MRLFAFCIVVKLFAGVVMAAEPVVASSPSQNSKTSPPVTEKKPQADSGDKSNATTPAPQAEAESTFDLMELRVKGNTKLEDTVIERTVYPFLGPKKSIDTVISAQKALEEIYRQKGYQTVVVDIPEQDVENGVVYLQVVEGKVSRLRVTDSRYFSLGKIKAAVPEAAEGEVPNFPIMQKQIEALTAKSPDRSVTPILRAGETPGTLEVDLKVKDKMPLHGKLELNGRNTSSTSLLRLVASLHYDNLWQQLHSASLMYQVSPENSQEVDVWAGTYAMPLPSTDAKLVFYIVSSSSNAAIASAGALNVIGIGDIYGLRLVKPLPGFENYSHNLTLGVDYKDFQENLNLVGSDKPITTPIDYIPFSAQYSSTLNLEASQLSFNTGLTFGVRGLANQSSKSINSEGKTVIDGEFENKRFGGQPNFLYLTLGGSYLRQLPYDMEFFGKVSAQIADSPLISNEQFSMGGMQSIRGYFETQALADDGFIGTLELRSPHLAPLSMDYLNKLQMLAFLDGGYGTVQQSIGSNPSSFGLASLGMGLRFQIWKYFSGILDLGFPLRDLDTVHAGNPKLHFSIASEF